MTGTVPASGAQAPAPAPRGAPRPPRAARVAPHGVLVWGVSTCSLAFLVLPTVFVIIVSFGRDRFVSFPPEGLTLVWFRQIDPMFWSALWFSVQVGVVATLASLLLGVPAALALVRGRFRLRGLVGALVRAPLQMPYIVIGVAFFQYFRLVGDALGLQLQGTRAGLVVAHVVITAPFALSAVVVGLERFDPHLEEAAYGLGMGRVRTFFHVTLPVIKPSLFAGTFFSFLISFDNVPVSLYLGVAHHNVLPVAMFLTAETSPTPSLYAVSAVVTVLSVVAVVTFNRLVGLRSAVNPAAT
jgi:putative spermidine/putrescine transport system permease protein